MLPTFEEYTRPLADSERSLIRKILSIWEGRTSARFTSKGDIIPYLEINFGVIIADVRLRKILSELRKNGLKWGGKILISTSDGYHWSDDANEILDYASSIEGRITGTLALLSAANDYLQERTTNKRTDQ